MVNHAGPNFEKMFFSKMLNDACIKDTPTSIGQRILRWVRSLEEHESPLP
jgi:hypothetical protein